MYKAHKRILLVQIIATTAVAYYFDVPFNRVTSDSIAVVSIGIAVYLTAITLLIGSKIADSMREIDHIIQTKTKLGVLIAYIRCAVLIGIASILDNCFLIVYKFEEPEELEQVAKSWVNLYRMVSAIGVALFIATLIFMYLIFRFISVSIMNKENRSV